MAFRVRSATGAACSSGAANLLAYSKRSWWQSYARQKETVVLALYAPVLYLRGAGDSDADVILLWVLNRRESKTLLAEIRVLNKVRWNALSRDGVGSERDCALPERVCCRREPGGGGSPAFLHPRCVAIRLELLGSAPITDRVYTAAVKRLPQIAHHREVAIKTGYFPCRFIK